MNRYSAGVILGLLAYAWAPTLAEAVTVNIEISTEGEPVPGTTITFQTAEGEDIPPVDVTELTEEPESASEAESATPASSSNEPESAEPSETAVPEDSGTSVATSGHGFQVELPDTVAGKDVVIVVRKDDTLIKREPVTLEEESSDVAIEAYDPADAEIALELSQPEKCKSGDRCDYRLAFENKGNGIYVGPVFLTGQLHGTVAEPESEAEWWCRYAGGGRQFCLTHVSLEPGTSKTWTLTAQLPGRISKGASNCLEIQTLDKGASGRVDPVVQAVQAGLATKGVSAGRPDGIAGAATKAAMAKFIDQEGLDPSADQQAIFEALFGLSPERFARLGISTGKDCETVDLIPQPQTVTKEPKGEPTASKKSGSTKRTTSDERKKERRKRALGTAVGVGVGIGTGLATQGSGKKSGGRQRYNH